MCCEASRRIEMPDVVDRLARLVAVDTIITDKIFSKSILSLDPRQRSKVQAVMLAKVTEYKRDEDKPIDDEDDDDFLDDDICFQSTVRKGSKNAGELEMEFVDVIQASSYNKLAVDVGKEVFRVDLDLKVSLEKCFRAEITTSTIDDRFLNDDVCLDSSVRRSKKPAGTLSMEFESVPHLYSYKKHAREAARKDFCGGLDVPLKQCFPEKTTINELSVNFSSANSPRVVKPSMKWFVPLEDVKRGWAGDVGKGSFGEAYLGTWLGAPVALKRLKFFTLGAARSLQEEANIWFNVRHPNIVSLFGACTRGCPLFVCDFVEGGRLEDCHRKKVSEQKIWGYLHDAAIGLQGLHMHGVVHADLKCDNILITADDRAKLIDFGLSCLQTCDGGAFRGAPRWKAPECLEGAGPTFESDVFGYGMCIVQALTGMPPYGTISEEGVIVRYVKAGQLPVQPLCFTAPQCGLVRRMCCKDPQDRLYIDSVVRALGFFANRKPYVNDAKLREEVSSW